VSFRDELAWWWFYLPRGGVQALARRLPLDRVRDALPQAISSRLRFGLYPARVGDPAEVTCARRHAPWGIPAALDPSIRVSFEAPPRASVLIVTYGNLELTRLCLASLQRFAGKTPFEIILVDNGSTDGTPQWLRETEASRLLPLAVALNDENRGFAGANNQAASLARGDLLVFLNNDTVVTPGWLDRLVAHLDAHPDLGLIGPRTNSCGNEAELGTRYADLDGMLRFAAEHTADPTLSEPSMLTLFCAAIPAALYEQIGGLDEQYRVGMFEDDDLTMAVRRAGRRVALAHDVFVHHYGGAAFLRLEAAEYLRIWWENRRRFERKWGVTWAKR
jgi:GT2 family glycosyltransferase